MQILYIFQCLFDRLISLASLSWMLSFFKLFKVHELLLHNVFFQFYIFFVEFVFISCSSLVAAISKSNWYQSSFNLCFQFSNQIRDDDNIHESEAREIRRANKHWQIYSNYRLLDSWKTGNIDIEIQHTNVFYMTIEILHLKYEAFFPYESQ